MNTLQTKRGSNAIPTVLRSVSQNTPEDIKLLKALIKHELASEDSQRGKKNCGSVIKRYIIGCWDWARIEKRKKKRVMNNQNQTQMGIQRSRQVRICFQALDATVHKRLVKVESIKKRFLKATGNPDDIHNKKQDYGYFYFL